MKAGGWSGKSHVAILWTFPESAILVGVPEIQTEIQSHCAVNESRRQLSRAAVRDVVNVFVEMYPIKLAGMLPVLCDVSFEPLPNMLEIHSTERNARDDEKHDLLRAHDEIHEVDVTHVNWVEVFVAEDQVVPRQVGG